MFWSPPHLTELSCAISQGRAQTRCSRCEKGASSALCCLRPCCDPGLWVGGDWSARQRGQKWNCSVVRRKKELTVSSQAGRGSGPSVCELLLCLFRYCPWTGCTAGQEAQAQLGHSRPECKVCELFPHALSLINLARPGPLCSSETGKAGFNSAATAATTF